MLKPTFAVIFSLIPLLAGSAAVQAPVHVAGSSSAPITIELYSDFQCPACKALHESTIEDLRHNYVNTGKVRLVYRDIHLPAHKYARLAACYADAAEKLGMYDPVANKLFETQQMWEANGKVDEVVASVVPAAQMMKLRSMANDPVLGAAIDARTTNAIQQDHIPGTPTMFIHHGAKVERVGQVSSAILSRYLDELLSKQ